MSKGQYKELGFPDKEKIGPGLGGRDQLLENVKQIRDSKTKGWTDWGHLALRIPEVDYAILMRLFPDLNSPDHEIKRIAWAKFFMNPLCAPYKIEASLGKKGMASHKKGIIIK